jgi:retron-type reverse transcriptase
MIEKGLRAGYLDAQGQHVKTNIGTPQGSVLSPLLANIVLDRLDKFIESKREELHFGTKRKDNLE